MKKSILVLSLIACGLVACGPKEQSAPKSSPTGQESATSILVSPGQASLPAAPAEFVDTEYTLLDSTGRGIIIQNSLPKGGGSIDSTGIRGYTDADGTFYSCGFFWTRVINNTEALVTVRVQFPAEFFPVTPSLGSHFKLFLSPDTMTVARQAQYNYGIMGARALFEGQFHQPTMWQNTIAPRGESFFYVALLLHMPEGNEAIRAGLVAEGQQLLYQINLGPMGTTAFPCGQLVFAE